MRATAAQLGNFVVDRPELVERVASPRSAIVGVWAPAGFGKSTLAALWTERSDRVWLSLDPGDDDESRFRARLWSQLDGGHDAGQAPPPIDTIVQAWRSRVVAIVLDDVNVLEEPAALDVVRALCAAATPASKLLLLGRHAPRLDLDRFRVAGTFDEITSFDLRFSEAEVTEVFARRGVPIDREQLAAVALGTEGWPAGVALVVQGIRRGGGLMPVLTRIGSFDRHVGDFVDQELLAGLPDELRTFVSVTAWFDVFCAELCDEVLGRIDSRAMIRELEDLQIAVNPPDDDGRWHRYHHLVVDHFRSPHRGDRPADLAELHRRAARWFEHEGQRDECVAHAFAAGDHAYAAKQVLRYIGEYDRRGRMYTVRAWLARLPVEIREQPSTQLGIGWSLIQTGNPLDALDLLSAAPEAPEPVTADDVEMWVVRSFAQRMLFRHDEVLDTTRHAFRLLDRADGTPRRRSFLRLQAINQTIDVLAWRHRLDEATRLAESAARLVGPTGHRMAGTRLLGVEALIDVDRGRMRQANRLAIESLAAGRRLGGHDWHAAAEAMVADALVTLESGDLAAATTKLREALDVAVTTRWPTTNVRAMLALAGLVDDDEATALVKAVRALNALAADPLVELRIELTWAERSARSGARDALQAQVRRLTRQILSPVDRSRLVLLAIAAELDDVAREQARSLTGAGDGVPRARVAAAIADAVVAGDANDAATALAGALALAEANGLHASLVPALVRLRPALERVRAGAVALTPIPSPGYVAELNAACGPPPAAAVFSDRELDVVAYIPTRLMAEEIAAELFISVNTVKTHLRNIYRKLGVANRNEASRRLDELHINGWITRQG